MMQTDAQLTSSPKDTDTHTRGTFNHNFKTHTFACVYALTLKSSHTHPLTLFECMKH